MNINIINSNHFHTISKIYLKGPDEIKIDLCFNERERKWYPKSVFDEPDYDSFYYIINEQFPLCSPLTKKYYTLDNMMFLTQKEHSVESNKEFLNMKNTSRICSKLDAEYSPLDSCVLFTKNVDPAAIIALEINSVHPITSVVTIEWLYSNTLVWITAKPFEISGTKKTFNGINLNDASVGNWTCNLYIGLNKVASHKFKVIDMGNKMPAKSLFINSAV